MALDLSTQTQQSISRVRGRYPNSQAALIPVLHLIQDEVGHLSDEALDHAARLLDLPLSHVFGVVTFYTMFRRTPPARHRLHVCSNIGCVVRAGYDAMEHAHKRLGIRPGQATSDGLFSLDEDDDMIGCSEGASVVDGDSRYQHLTRDKLDRLLDELRQRPAPEGGHPNGFPPADVLGAFRSTAGEKIVTKNIGVPDIRKLATYQARGGWQAFRKALGMQRTAIVEDVKASNLRGRGGAGFSTGMKWGFLPKDAKQVYLVVNADESEPGTFKDRVLLVGDPHLLVEGIAVSAYALGCVHAYIFIRGELASEAKILQTAVDEAYAAGLLGKPHPSAAGPFTLDLTVHRGAGAYICGEETSLLNSLEGKRGWPRMKPPFPAVRGLFGQPTIVNNVETLMNIPDIVMRGGAAFAKLGMGRSGGTRVLSVSGHVNRPGVFELPMGISFRQLIDEHCGGMVGGRRLKGIIPGGSSMPVLDASEIDVPIEFDALMTDARIKDVEVGPGVPFDMGGGKRLKTMAGSGGIVVFDETTDVVAFCATIMRFYAHESCGQCTPCREGTAWLARVCSRLADGEGRPGDVELLANIASGIAGNTICPLGEAAAWPMLGFLTKFRADFQAKLSTTKGAAQ
ncbi:MAG TPA: NADH-quinone oxidoreductase subunit NuoF [Polyangia bacterium]